ncbi:glycosyl transferase family protein, partial [Methanocaldococcus villosus KIN24-T80]
KNKDVDIFYTNVQKYDITLRKKVKDKLADRLTILEDTTAKGFLEYSKKLPPAGGYISNLIFKRKAWNSVPNKNKYIGTAYVHFYIFITLLNRGSKIKFIPYKLVGQRLENDSFIREVGGKYNRLILDFNTLDIFKEVFGNTLGNMRSSKKNY